MNPFVLSPGIGSISAQMYDYTTYDIKFTQSITCLEGNPLGLFNPIKLYQEFLNEFLYSYFPQLEPDNEEQDEQVLDED